MSFEIKRVYDFPNDDFNNLKIEGSKDGFRFLERLEIEWEEKVNQFSKRGEGLYSVYFDKELVGIGGINIDPYFQDHQIGRLRRFYILKKWRRNGVGKQLLEYILKDSKAYFNTIHLRTDNEKAAKFYEKCGFELVENQAFITHRMIFPNH